MIRHVVLAPQSDRYIIDVPDLLVLTKTFTAADPGATTPVPVPLGTGRRDPPVGVEIIRAENLTDSTSTFYETVSCPAWTFDPTSGVISLNFITGIMPAMEYRLTFKITYA